MDHCFVYMNVTVDSVGRRGLELQLSEARSHAARVAHHRRRIQIEDVIPSGQHEHEAEEEEKEEEKEAEIDADIVINVQESTRPHADPRSSVLPHSHHHLHHNHHRRRRRGHESDDHPGIQRGREPLHLHRPKRRTIRTVPVLVGSRSSSPRDVLSQYKRDPFNNDRMRELPGMIHDLMEYAYETMWPNNMPGLDRSIVKLEMNARRRLALHSQLELHCQVSNMSSLAFNLPHEATSTLAMINQFRMVHQNLAIPLLRAEIAALNGRPPSEELIARVVLLDTQGAEPVDNWAVHIHPDSPILAGTNVGSYYRFRPSGGSQGMGGKAKVFRRLVEKVGGIHNISPGLARRLYVFDVSDSTAEFTRPMFPLVPELVPQRKFDIELDEDAVTFQACLGSGFAIIQDALDYYAAHNHQQVSGPGSDYDMTTVVAEICRLTVALDQYHRTRHRHNQARATLLSDLTCASLRLQHQLYALPSYLEGLNITNTTGVTGMVRRDSNSKSKSKLLIDAHVLESLGLAFMVYTDMVLYPLPWHVGVKPNLAKHLRTTIDALLNLLGPLPLPLPHSPEENRIPERSSLLSLSLSSLLSSSFSSSSSSSPPPPQGAELYDLLLWLLLIGGIAATFTPHQHWFVEQLDRYAEVLHCNSFEDFKYVVKRFLWWDYVFEEPAAGLWEEKKLWRSART